MMSFSGIISATCCWNWQIIFFQICYIDVFEGTTTTTIIIMW